MNIKKVTVIGAGIMGSQIAMQAAIHGFSVVCYDIKKRCCKSGGIRGQLV